MSGPRPGDLCRIIRGEKGASARIEHVAPCPDHHATGTITDVSTGRIVRQAVAR